MPCPWSWLLIFVLPSRSTAEQQASEARGRAAAQQAEAGASQQRLTAQADAARGALQASQRQEQQLRSSLAQAEQEASALRAEVSRVLHRGVSMGYGLKATVAASCM